MHRDGFTLLEVVIGLIIMGVVVLSLGRFAGEFLHAVGTSTTRTVAAAVATERLQTVKADPTYPLPASWAGTTTGFPDYPAMTRITVLNRVTGASPARDYTVISVKVTEPTMTRPGTAVQDTVRVLAVVAPR